MGSEILLEALKIAVIGFTLVIATFCVLAVSVKVMSFICNIFDKKERVG